MRFMVSFGLLVTLSVAAAQGAEFAAEDLEFFENRIRPMLVQHCSECHSQQSKTLQGGLRLDNRAAILEGGDTGPAVVAGDVEASLLVSAIRYGDVYQMPPAGKLPPNVIADIEEWIRRGAPAPDGPSSAEVTAETGESIDWASVRQYWSFQPLATVRPPHVSDHAAGAPIDQFVAARLESSGLTPSLPADKHTLIRRAYFDLLGLPPTADEVRDFLADDAPDAFARLVDRLLASPHYGERWGRYWLDLARYADTNGADENYVYHNAWRYRDYVVRSFNQDKPYDRFVVEQLAGDLLPPADDPQAADDQLTATGFLALGPKMLAEQDKEKLVADLIDEQIDTVGKTFFAMTLGCARCHDHKFDPIPTEDYYALAGIFHSTRSMEHLSHVSEWLERPLAAGGNRQRYLELEAEITAKTEQRDRFFSNVAQVTQEMRAEREELTKQIEELEKQRASIATVMAVADQQPRDVAVHVRGSHLQFAGQPVPRGTISLFEHLLSAPPIAAADSGRLQLAEWLTERAHPLTARVMVNRIWQGHFGQGLVATPSDFGLRGAAPTHPELLDWLALRFIESGWSLKAMHREIMLSRTYQMSSSSSVAAEVDPDNRLLWRQNRRRLEVEPLRDALLAVTGDLDSSVGGKLEDTPGDSKYARTTESPYGSRRRALYLPVVRNRPHEMFAIFDYVDSGVHLPQRSATTVPHQALFLMNSALVIDRAQALASALRSIRDDRQRLEQTYLLLFARPCHCDEYQLAINYLDEVASDPSVGDRERAWISLCRVLLTANEFLFIN